MRDTPLGNKFEATDAKCEDDERTKSLQSEREEEEKTHCATYQHIKHYLDKKIKETNRTQKIISSFSQNL